MFHGFGDICLGAFVRGVVAAHDALQFREFADHVSEQVDLAQQAGVARLCRVGAQLAGDKGGKGAETLSAVTERAELVVVDHRAEFHGARNETVLFVLLEEKAGIREAGSNNALVTANDGRGVGGVDVADQQELISQFPFGIEEREIFLVGLHGQDQAFLWYRQEFLIETADHDLGSLNEGRDFVEQRVVGDRPGAGLLGRCAELAGNFGSPFSKRGDHGTFIAELRGITVGVAHNDRIDAGFEAVTVGDFPCREAEDGHRDDLCAVQGYQGMRRANEMHRTPAVFQLVAHDLRDGQRGKGDLDRFLQAFLERGAFGLAVVKQNVGLAVAFPA